MRSDNLQLPCEQPPTSSNNLQLPHGRHGHGGHGDHFCHGGRGGHGGILVIVVVMNMVNIVVMVVRTEQEGTGRDCLLTAWRQFHHRLRHQIGSMLK